ncbi:MAG: porin [Rhizobiales bacterium]|nr:porin [Hyphomicrobiales bacterium]
MKKILLGTTALVSAAAAFSAPALASDPLAVTVSGTVVAGFYVADIDTPSGTSFEDTAVKLVARNIDIAAEGTLDNGMTVGALAKLQLGNDESVAISGGDATFNELYAYLEGGFGRFEIGGTDGAAFKMHYTSPWFVPGNGVDSPNIYNNNSVYTPGAPFLGQTIASRTSTFALMTEDANKVSYFTPRFAGFQLGLSFTPDTSAGLDPRANGFGFTATNNTFAQNVFEVALNYSGSFGGVDVGVDGFYVTGEAGANTGDPEEYGAGANLGYMGFTLGGAYYKSEDIANASQNSVAASTLGIEKEVWTVGLSYGTGPWTVGAAYIEGTTSFAGTSAELKNDMVQVGGGYNLGAGVDIGLDVQFINNDFSDFGGADIDSTSGGLVLAVSF